MGNREGKIPCGVRPNASRGRGIVDHDLRVQESAARPEHEQPRQHRQGSPPVLTLPDQTLSPRVNPRSQMSPGTKHDSPNNVLGRDWRIALLAGVATGEKAIAGEVFKDQAMSAESAGSFGDHDITDAETLRRHVFDAQGLAVLDQREHAPASGLKLELMAAGQQSPAQLLEQRGIAPRVGRRMFSRGTQGFSPPHSGQEQNGSDNTAAHPLALRATLAPDPQIAIDKKA